MFDHEADTQDGRAAPGAERRVLAAERAPAGGVSPPAASEAVVLGIDPGVSTCGYGAVRRDRGTFRAVACGVIRTPASDSLPDRLAALQGELEALVDEVAPSALAVERVLFQVNTRTAMSVGQASGLALAVAGRRGIPVTHYSPNEVKLAVAGDGGAGKQEVQAMVARLLGLTEAPQPADAADALALALCHWWRARVPSSPNGAAASLQAAIKDAVARQDAQAASRTTAVGGVLGGTR